MKGFLRSSDRAVGAMASEKRLVNTDQKFEKISGKNGAEYISFIFCPCAPVSVCIQKGERI